MGLSYIHKNVEECLSECCIISFETLVEKGSFIKSYHQLSGVFQCLCLEGCHRVSLQCFAAKGKSDITHCFYLLNYSVQQPKCILPQVSSLSCVRLVWQKTVSMGAK